MPVNNLYSVDYNKILVRPETREPKGCYCMRHIRANVPLAKEDFSFSKTQLENRNPLVLREKQVSKNIPKRSTSHLTVYLSNLHSC